MGVRAAVTLSVLVCAAVLRPQAFDARLPIVQVEVQPLAAQAARIADALAYAATVLGDPDALNLVMESYERVTPEDVRRVAAQYLPPERAATLVVVPGEGSAEEDDEEVADAA